MHCDDKRTITALQQYIIDAASELHDLEKQVKNEMNNTMKIEIQNRINYLEKTIKEAKEQLSTMS
jgi:predicted  nucleic acid-binding Zn-ribbon protein